MSPRVVSLVPSATETLVALGVEPVGCTRFCLQDGIPTVGGTKSPDVDAVAALDPDVVVVNDEENRLEDLEALQARGLATRAVSPRSVEESGRAVVELADVAGVGPPEVFEEPRWSEWLAGRRRLGGPRAFVAVWRRPWMGLGGDTYGSSLLGLLGVANVLADAADRYPEVTLAEVAERGADVVLLATEPYPFRERHVERVGEELPATAVRLVDGQDLFWWGVRTPEAVERLAATLDAE